METTRQQKFGRLVQKEIADIFLREGSEYVAGAMVTVTEARVSPDLSVAKIYVSIFPPANRTTVFERIRKNVIEIRRMLGARIRHQARVTPEIIFYLDDTLDQAQHIEELLKKI